MATSAAWLTSVVLAAVVLGGAVSPPTEQELRERGFLGSLEGHRGHIYALAISPDGLVATGARDKTVAVWNLSAPTGPGSVRKPYRILEGFGAGITALAFARGPAAEGQVLISGSADNTSRIWNWRSGEVRKVLPHPRTVFGVSVRPGRAPAAPQAAGAPADGEGEFATACWDAKVRIFDLATAVQTSELAGHGGGLYGVAYSPLDGSLLASASADRTVRIWDADKGELLWTLSGFRDHAVTVDWSPSEPFALATGSWDRRFRLWRIPQKEVEACRGPSRRCSQSLAPSATGRHPQLIWRVAFSSGGERVAACHGAVGQSPTVVIYDALTGKVVRRLGRHRDTPLMVAWSPDGAMLASAGMDRQVLLYDAHAAVDDLPRGDMDDSEERALWKQDLAEYAGRLAKNATNATSASGRNGTEATEAAPDSAEAFAQRLPHPLNGMAAIM